MKKLLQKVLSMLKRFFLFLKLHIRIEAGIRSSNNVEEQKADSDAPEVKDRVEGENNEE